MLARSEPLPLLASLGNRKRCVAVNSKAKVPSTIDSSDIVGDRTSKVFVAKKGKTRKNAPAEVSSRRPALPVSTALARRRTAQPRDPRFSDQSGTLNVEMFQKAYSFLDEYREDEKRALEEEREKLGKLSKRVRGQHAAWASERTEAIKTKLSHMKQEDTRRKFEGEVEATRRELQREEREKVKITGKTPYFHKPGEIRQIVRAKRKGKSARSKQEEKREKRVTNREKRRLPSRRTPADEVA